MLPPKVVLTKLAPILEQSLGYPFVSKNKAELFTETTIENKKKFVDWYKQHKPSGQIDATSTSGGPSLPAAR